MFRVVVCLFLLTLSASGAEVRQCWALDLRDCPWDTSCTVHNPDSTTPVTLSAWKRISDSIISVVKRTDGFLTIRGLRPQVEYSLAHIRRPGSEIAARLRVTMNPKSWWDDSCAVKTPVMMLAERKFNHSSEESFCLYLDINDPNDELHGPVWPPRGGMSTGDDSLEAFTEPVIMKQYGSAAMYSFDQVILAPTGVAPWVPVNHEEYLRYWIRHLRSEIADISEARADTTLDSIKFAEEFLDRFGEVDPEDEDDEEFHQKMFKSQFKQRGEAVRFHRENQDRYVADSAMMQNEIAEISARMNILVDSLGAEPVKLGSGRFGLATPKEAKSARRLVKFNVGMKDGPNGPRRVYLITIYDNDWKHDFRKQIDRILNQIDYAGLQKLLDE